MLKVISINLVFIENSLSSIKDACDDLFRQFSYQSLKEILNLNQDGSEVYIDNEAVVRLIFIFIVPNY
jgi:hypothetical protein